MKRTLAIILTLMMIFGAVACVPSGAAETSQAETGAEPDLAETGSPKLVDTLYASITLPEIGGWLRNSKTDHPMGRGYNISTLGSSEGFKNGLRFLDENDNIINDEKVVAGETYRVQLLFRATGSSNDYRFYKTDMRGFINGKAAEVVSVTDEYAILQTYVTAPPKKKISYVPIYVIITNAGEKVSFYLGDNSGILWYCETDHRFLDENDVFEEGKTYVVRVIRKISNTSKEEFDVENLTGSIDFFPTRVASVTSDTAVFECSFVHKGLYRYKRFQARLGYVDYEMLDYSTADAVTMPYDLFDAPEGYYFDHWDSYSSRFENADYVASYQPGVTYDSIEGACLVPVYKPMKKVTFDANGGEGTIAAQYFMSGDKLMLPDCTFFPPEGYEFKDWLIGGHSYAPGDKVTVRNDVTVSARYQKTPYCNVYYSPNGGNGSMDYVSVRQGAYYILAECQFTPWNSDYEFSHWEVDGVSRRPGEKIKVNKSLNVFAEWQLTKYVPVTFDANGGSGTMGPREARRGYSYYLPNCEFTPPEGKRFDCWLVKGEYLKPSKSVTADSAFTAIAQWVDAPDTIDSVEVYLDKAPYADNLPSTNVEIPWFAGYYVASAYWESFANGYNWTRLDPSTSRYIEGKQYRITVILQAEDGYEFDTDNLTAKLNDEDAELLDRSTASYVYVRYTFVCGPSDLEAIPLVEVSVDFPKAGESFSYKPEVFIPSTATYHLDERYGVQWRGSGEDDAFVAGEMYWIIIYIIPDDGFYFDPYEDVTISVNGNEKFKDITSSQKFRTQIMYSFVCESDNSDLLLGDVDGDGAVTILDATAIQLRLADIAVDQYIEAVADADYDGGVTIADVTEIQKWLADLPSNENIGRPIG